MSQGASVSGTLTKVAAGGTAAAGTFPVINDYGSGAATGTLAIDRTLFLAFYSRVRLTRPDVYVAGELMANLVESVEIDESLDDPIKYATFTLSDKRVAFFDAASLSNGERAVAIDLWSGPPGGVLKWENAFTGNSEGPSNTMPYRPRGNFRSVSLAAKWADVTGCLNVPPMSGLTRGQIIAAIAESAGVVIANAASIGGAIVRKKIDIVGTPLDIINAFGEIEGWRARAMADGTGLEIINEDTLLDGEPVFAFDESNTFDVPETTPDRPVTKWILSGTRLSTLAGTAGVGNDPVTTVTASPGIDTNTIVESTTEAGVEVKRIETQWAKVVTPGWTLTAAVFQIISRVTITSEWEPHYTLPTPSVYAGIWEWDAYYASAVPSTQLNSRQTTTELLMGVPQATDWVGNPGYTWVQGGVFTKATALLQVAEILDETYTWNDDCSPSSSLIVRQQIYSPLDSVGYTYTDGTLRAEPHYSYSVREVMRDYTYWPPDFWWGQFNQFHSKESALIGTGLLTSNRWYQATPDNETYGVMSPNAFPVAAIAPIAAVATLGPGSSSISQVDEEVIMVEVDATVASGYPLRTESPGMLPYPESVNELNAVAWRRIIRSLSDTLDIPHNAIPFLRVGDHVSVTNHARTIVGMSAYISAIKRSAVVTNGAMRQVTTVKIPPAAIVELFRAERAAWLEAA